MHSNNFSLQLHWLHVELGIKMQRLNKSKGPQANPSKNTIFIRFNCTRSAGRTLAPPTVLQLTSRTAGINEPVGARQGWGAGSPSRQSCSTLALLPLTADMAEAFVGTWNLLSSEKFDDYMKELGECAVFGVHLGGEACVRACQGEMDAADAAGSRMWKWSKRGLLGVFKMHSSGEEDGRDAGLRWKSNVDRRRMDGGREGWGWTREEWLTTWQKCWRRGRGPLGVGL